MNASDISMHSNVHGRLPVVILAFSCVLFNAIVLGVIVNERNRRIRRGKGFLQGHIYLAFLSLTDLCLGKNKAV